MRWRRSAAPRPRRRAGYTLFEVMVAAGIGLLLLSATTDALIDGLGKQAVWQGQAELQAQGSTALSRLADELSESSSAGVRIDATPAGIVFASPRDAMSRVSFDLSGTLQWKRFICYYLDSAAGQPVLVRKESALATATSPAPSPGTAYTTAWFQALSGGRTLASSVSGLACSGSAPLSVTLTLVGGSKRRPQQLQLTTNVYLRN